MSKKVILITNDEQVADTTIAFLAKSEHELVSFIDQQLRSSGYGETDTTVSFSKDKREVRISSRPEDKGNVFIFDASSNKLKEVPYTEVKDKDFYVYLKDGKMIIYHKFEGENTVDKQLGSLKSLDIVKDHLSRLPEAYAKSIEEQEKAREQKANMVVSDKDVIEDAVIIEEDEQ